MTKLSNQVTFIFCKVAQCHFIYLYIIYYDILNVITKIAENIKATIIWVLICFDNVLSSAVKLLHSY